MIEALPPIRSTAEIASMIEWLLPAPQESDRAASAELRIHALPSIRKLIYLLPEYGLYSSIFSVVLREGYTTRNPVRAETWQHLHYVNNGGQHTYGVPEPCAHRSSGILFSGLSGTGKSTFVNRLLQLYPQVIQHTRYGDHQFIHPQLVWIKIDCPHNGSLSGLALRFFAAVDKALGTSYARANFPSSGRSPKLAVLLEEMSAVAANHFLGVLIIDELQNLSRAVAAQSASAPAFVPVPLETATAHPAEIRIEVRRADQSITVSWPTSEAAQCAAWLREWLR
ncbi:hypothetical protein WS62_30750 [Burkholderia sp. ABCPW 14]|nr:hypothetical protein WS62_30750 [Burkholderia sp. ABCPW 14]